MENKKTLIIAVVGYLCLVGVLTVLFCVFRDADQFFFNLASAIILSWVVTLIIYFIWAIYFYHVNMGWEDADWDRLHQRKEEEGHGVLDDEPIVNPHNTETFGLPPGTIRGTLALSLLIAGLALIIASLEMNQTFDSNLVFIDNLEFFKTAFLMMIAFYFGHKSLEAISKRDKGIDRPNELAPSGVVHAASNSKDEGAIITPVVQGEASKLKKTLQDQKTAETIDSGSTAEFDDEESIG